MSYNIDSSEYLKGKLRILKKTARDLYEKYQDEMAEINFLDTKVFNGPDDLDKEIDIDKLWWYGEGSGYSYEALKDILTHTKGKADILFTWEGGDSHTGLRVTNGKVKEMAIKIGLSDE